MLLVHMELEFDSQTDKSNHLEMHRPLQNKLETM